MITVLVFHLTALTWFQPHPDVVSQCILCHKDFWQVMGDIAKAYWHLILWMAKQLHIHL